MAMFSEKAQAILTFLQTNPNVDMTGKELAEAAGVAPRAVTGVINALVKKGLVVRDEQVIGEETVKFIRLTDAGMAVDPLAE